jgi:hypothetical protein
MFMLLLSFVAALLWKLSNYNYFRTACHAKVHVRLDERLLRRESI